MVLYPSQLLAIFNTEAIEAAGVLVILALAHGLHTAFNASEHMLVMSGKTLLSMTLGAKTLTVSMISTVPLTMYFGITGAAFGTLITYIFLNFSRLHYVYKLYDLHPFGTLLLWPLTCAILVFVFFYIFNLFAPADNLLQTGVMLMLMTISYISFYFLGPKEPEERYLLMRLRSRISRTSSTSE
ncbi:polysaccharide biosynthesis C-terminal domain-containing protein [Pseudomonadota bacterium]